MPQARGPKRRAARVGGACREPSFVDLMMISLICGNVVALALLFLSPLWLWELNESWPVAPAAALARRSPGSPVLLQGFDERPSLNWYAGQRIRRYDKGADGWVLSQKQGLDCPNAAKIEGWTLLNCR